MSDLLLKGLVVVPSLLLLGLVLLLLVLPDQVGAGQTAVDLGEVLVEDKDVEMTTM